MIPLVFVNSKSNQLANTADKIASLIFSSHETGQQVNVQDLLNPHKIL